MQVNVIGLPTALPQGRAGKMRILAVTGSQRSLQILDVPTSAARGH
jgi:tripartite-type tricarboxylate transporter receptor subunit TctC